MAIRVLLDHGVPESSIIFLAFLISQQGHHSVHRAFPAVKIVTAAIDTGLQEMHLPLGSLSLGEGEGQGWAGDGDFAVRLVGDPSDLTEEEEEEEKEGGREGYEVKREEEMLVGFKMPRRKVDSLKFSRGRKGDRELKEKRAWVISPGESGLSWDLFLLMRVWQVWGILGKYANPT